jgi:hypothetical protein
VTVTGPVQAIPGAAQKENRDSCFDRAMQRIGERDDKSRHCRVQIALRGEAG